MLAAYLNKRECNNRLTHIKLGDGTETPQLEAVQRVVNSSKVVGRSESVLLNPLINLNVFKTTSKDS